MNKCTTAVHHFLSSIQLIYTILLILHLLKHTLILRYTNLFGLTKRRTASFHAFIRSKGGTRRMEKMRDEFVEDGIVSVLSRACYETRSEQRRAFNTTHDLNRAEIEAIRASGEVHSKGVVPTDRFSHGKQPRLRLPQKFRKTDFFLLFPSFSLCARYRIAFRSLHHSAKIMVNIYIYIQYCLLYRLSLFKRKLLLFVDRIAWGRADLKNC